jgi:hypothetical protein
MDRNAPSRLANPQWWIVVLLGAIVALLAYGYLSSWQSQDCARHIGEKAIVGTRTASDARWSLFSGCEVLVSDTSHLIFSHVSPLDADPDEWQDESQWQSAVDLEIRSRKMAQEAK